MYWVVRSKKRTAQSCGVRRWAYNYDVSNEQPLHKVDFAEVPLVAQADGLRGEPAYNNYFGYQHEQSTGLGRRPT